MMINLFSGKVTGWSAKEKDWWRGHWKHPEITGSSGLHNQEAGGASGREARPPGSSIRLLLLPRL